VTFDTPWALLGLLAIPLLVLLARRRSRPRPLRWPSLLLWQRIAEEAAPARRRVDRLLLAECAAVFLLALAAAGPVLRPERGTPRLTVLVDVSPRMDARLADGRTALEATRAEVDRMRDALDVDDVRALEVRGDVALAAASEDASVLATNREDVEGPGYLVLGRAADGVNLGVDAVEVRGGRMWFAVATDGPPRDVSVRLGGDVRTVRTGEGVWGPFAKSIEILDEDNYDQDDRISLRRFALVARDDTGSRFVRAALFAAGTAARPGKEPDLVLTREGGEPLSGVVYGTDCVASECFEGLLLDDCAWRGARARDGAGILDHAAGALARWVDERTLWLGLPVDRPWDEHGTLAMLVERAKRRRIRALLEPDEALVGDAVATPAPGHVDTRGVDRPWDGTVPELSRAASRGVLRFWLSLGAAAVLAVYVRLLLGRA